MGVSEGLAFGCEWVRRLGVSEGLGVWVRRLGVSEGLHVWV